MSDNDNWTAELLSDAEAGYEPGGRRREWYAVSPVNSPGTMPSLPYMGTTMPDGRRAYPFADEGTAREVADEENAFQRGELDR